MSAKPSFFAELKRRHVYKVGAMYAIGGWLFVQVVTQVLPLYETPTWVLRSLVTVVIVGFPIALVLSWVFDLTPEGLVRTDDLPNDNSPPQVSARRGMDRKLNYLLGGLLIVALAYVASDHWVLSRAQTAPATSPSRASPPGAVTDKSIAVMPFENLSDDKANAYFADGMQDEILTKLSKIGALKVISRTSTAHYASSPDNLPEIAKQLGVTNILEGRVQKSGNSVHITVQLIDAATDTHLWAESYDRKLDDIFGVEGEVAQAVAEALNAKLSGAEKLAVAAKSTLDPGAYEAYLRGVAIEGASAALPARVNSIDAYLDATRRDPGFALAWARASIGMSFLYAIGGFDPGRSTPAAIEQAADAALRLQPELGEAHLAYGYFRLRVQGDYAGALAEFKLALQKLPNEPRALTAMSTIEVRLGLLDDALAHCREAVQRDPRNVPLLVSAGNTLMSLRKFDEARKVLSSALLVTPGDTGTLGFLAWVEQRSGRLDAAEAWLAQTTAESRQHDPLVIYTLGYQFLYQRRVPEAIGVLRAALPKEGEALFGPNLLTVVYLGYAEKWAGQTEAARASFERAIQAVKARPAAPAGVATDDLWTLALAYAGLNRHAAALAAARSAVELNGTGAIKDPLDEIVLAQVNAQVGNHDVALAALPQLLRVPNGLTPALLALDPLWDPLRGDPRFQKLIADGEAATMVKAKSES